MDIEDIQGLSHWTFTGLYQEHRELYIIIYRKAVDSVRNISNGNPSIASLEKAVQGLLADEGSFTDYCESKLPVNIEWRRECLESFSEYIVYMLYNSIG